MGNRSFFRVDYYPFGMAFQHYNVGDENQYKFNGNEEQAEIPNVSDFNARFYDASLGRFFSIDPLADDPAQVGFSVYHFSYNNPVNFVDPTGLMGEKPKTVRDNDGNVIDPNGNTSDFANDWYAAVEGNLVMTNGTDYQVWDQESGTYKAGRAPKTWTSKKSLEDLTYSNYQIGDTFKQRQKDPYGVNYATGATGHSNTRTYRYLGDKQWVMLGDNKYLESADMVVNYFPLSGGAGATSKLPSLMKWLSRTYAGKIFINATKGNNYINLASRSRTAHIIAGDATGGGHAWFGSMKSFMNGLKGKKSMFPASWSADKIMNGVSEVVTSNTWVQQTGRAGARLTRSGQPVRFVTEGY